MTRVPNFEKGLLVLPKHRFTQGIEGTFIVVHAFERLIGLNPLRVRMLIGAMLQRDK